MEKTIDFTDELAEIMTPISDIALSIRIKSGHIPTQETLQCVRHLSDSLHNLNMVGDRIRSKDTEQIIWVCDFHLDRFQNYYPSLPGFEEHHAKRALLHTIDILIRIKEKVFQFKSKDSTDKIQYNV